jgi:hypothetical protein
MEEPPQKVRRMHAGPLGRNMLWGDPAVAEFSDAKVVAADGRVFAVHRAVLAAASPVFRAALRSDMKEGQNAELIVPDAIADALESMLRYIYTGETEISNPAAVLPLAHRYQLDDLVDQCVTAMIESLCPANIVSITVALRPLVEISHNASVAWERLQHATRLDPELLKAVFQSVREPLPIGSSD